MIVVQLPQEIYIWNHYKIIQVKILNNKSSPKQVIWFPFSEFNKNNQMYTTCMSRFNMQLIVSYILEKSTD